MMNDLCVDDCSEHTVQFKIDETQFAPALNPNDPPRRQVTFVTMGGAQFVAEAILMPGGIRGFYEEAGELGSRLMIVQDDGSARLSLQPSGQILTGNCAD